MSRLVGVVHVRDARGALHTFAPWDDPLPAWVRAAVRNPYAWTDEPAPPRPQPQAIVVDDDPDEDGEDVDPDDPQHPDNAALNPAERNPAGTQAIVDDQPEADPVPPPKGGKGSGMGPWRAYARRVGQEVPEGMDRDDIIALLERNNIRTERDED